MTYRRYATYRDALEKRRRGMTKDELGLALLEMWMPDSSEDAKHQIASPEAVAFVSRLDP